MQGYFGGSRFLLQVFKKNLKSAWLLKFCLLVGIVIAQINQKLDMLIKMLELWWGSRWKVQNISWYKKLPILSNKYHWSINNVLSFIQIFCFWWDFNGGVGKDMVPLVVTGKCSHALIHLRTNAACAKINMSFYKYQNEKDMQLKILKEEAR